MAKGRSLPRGAATWCARCATALKAGEKDFPSRHAVGNYCEAERYRSIVPGDASMKYLRAGAFALILLSSGQSPLHAAAECDANSLLKLPEATISSVTQEAQLAPHCKVAAISGSEIRFESLLSRLGERQVRDGRRRRLCTIGAERLALVWTPPSRLCHGYHGYRSPGPSPGRRPGAQ